jgi:hypothetical protein
MRRRDVEVIRGQTSNNPRVGEGSVEWRGLYLSLREPSVAVNLGCALTGYALTGHALTGYA